MDGSSLVLTGAERRSCTKLAQNDMHAQGQLCILYTALVTYQISSRLKLGAFDVQFGRWMVPLVPCLAPRPPLCPRWGSTFHSPTRQHFADLALHDLHKHVASQKGQPGQVKKVGLSLLYLYRILLSLFVSPAGCTFPSSCLRPIAIIHELLPVVRPICSVDSQPHRPTRSH